MPLPRLAPTEQGRHNIFSRKNSDVPAEVFNWRLWYAILTFGLMGAARGLDEGLISGTQQEKSFKAAFLQGSETEVADIKGNISSMVQIGSVLGALM
jgi:hypothetical protein